jgi:hypothetical protein
MLSKRDSRPHSPLYRFKLHDAIFTLSTDLVLEKLGLFQADPSRIRSGEYEVLSPVPVEIFRDFVKIVEGSSPMIADSNWEFFTRLSGEFCFGSQSSEFYRLSAEQGNARGQFNFGFCLEHGQGVAKDLVRAAEFYHLSAEQGNVEAQLQFGFCLEHGQGVPKDLVRAAEFYRRSAEQGNAEARCSFGFCLKHGQGIAKDLVLAAEFYHL